MSHKNGCEHSWLVPGARTPLAHCFEDWQGLICGLVQCQYCGSPAVLQLIAWRGKQLEDRLYSVGELPDDATEVSIRNMQSDYCDVTRQDREVEALMSLRHIQYQAWFSVPDLICNAVNKVAPPINHPDWQNLKPITQTCWYEN